MIYKTGSMQQKR